MAVPTVIQAVGASGSGTSSNPTVSLPVPPADQPESGDLLVAVLWDSSSGATDPMSAGAGWALVDSGVSPAGGISGSRIMRFSVARRTYSEGASTADLTPFSLPTGTNNWQMLLYLIRGADSVVAAFTAGHGMTSDPVTAVASGTEGLLFATVGVPRSSFFTIGASLTFPNPPFTFEQVIGTGFNNMSGGYSFVTFNAATPGPYQLAEFATTKDAWVTALVMVTGGTEAARIRSHISEDTGSLFQATQAVAVENAISKAFPYGTDLSAGLSRSFREAMTPELAALRYYPIPTRNQEMLVTIEGETNLGRMARVYPSRIMTRIADIAGFDSATSATAQEAIQYIFEQWSAEFDWFTFEAVPDLRLLQAAAVGNERQYYIDNAGAGVLSQDAIAIPQDDDNRKSMREIVDEWLGIFPGTIIRQNSSGNIELVARVGPDAPDGAAVDLTWRDLIGISDGEDDPRGVYNRARCESQGYEWLDEQVVAEPSYYITGGLAEGVLTSEGVHPEDDPRGKITLWQRLEFTGLVQQTAIEVDVDITVYGNGDDDTSQGFYTEATHTETIELLPGETKTVQVSYTVQLQSTTLRVYVQRVGDAVMVTAVTGGFAWASAGFTRTYLAHVIRLDASGTAWARSTSAITGEFGYSSSDYLPASGGGNALTDSVALYGEREATIRSTVFQLTAEQAQQVAQSYVLANINPRTIRDVQQSEWDKYPVKFDHIGRLVDLPNSERAVVENRNYSDSFAPNGGMMQSQFTATVTDVTIDTETPFLFMDDGSYMQLDDSSIAEEQ